MRKLKKKEPVTHERSVVRAKIISALNNANYSMRSLSGIAKEINVSLDELNKIISNDNVLSKSIKYMPFRSDDGKLLVMSKERFFKEASFKLKFMDFFASKKYGAKSE